MIEKQKKSRILQFFIVIAAFFALFAIIKMAIDYPKKIKRMFIQSSIQAMEKKQDASASYINDNIAVNYEEMRIVAQILSDKLSKGNENSQEVLNILQKAKKGAGFTNIGIMNCNDDHLFATMSDGKRVQLDTWVVDMEYNKTDASVELQTSPFYSADDGEDALVYRCQFQNKKGTPYLIIAEKTQDSINSILNVKQNTDGLTMLVRKNGNVMYTRGEIDHQKVKSYNVYAMLQGLGASQKEIAEIKKY